MSIITDRLLFSQLSQKNFYNSYLMVDNPLSSDTDFTISFWVYTTTTKTQCMLCSRNAVGQGLGLFIINSNNLRIDTGNSKQWYTTYTLPINTWVHITVTKTSSRLRLYVNGSLEDSNTSLIGNLSGLTSQLTIGAASVNEANVSYYLDGSMASLLIYDRELSSEEVLQNYKAATVFTTDLGRVSFPIQVIDNITSPHSKWFSLQGNNLSGSYAIMPTTEDYQVGWWGSELSNANGEFANTPTISVREHRFVHSLQIVGDNLLNEYPVDFTIHLYKNNTLLYTENVTGNNNVVWRKNLPQTYEVDTIEISVLKINKAYSTVKILDVFSPYEIHRTLNNPLNISEESAVGITVFHSDSTFIVTGEASSVTVHIQSNDSIKIDDNVNATVPLSEAQRSDTLMLQDICSTSADILFAKTDILNLNEINDNIVNTSQTRYDTLLLNSIESSLVSSSAESTDTIKIKEYSKTILPLYELWRSDIVTLRSVPNVSTDASFAKTDILNIDENINKETNAHQVSNDNLQLNKNVEQDLITASFNVLDSLSIKLEELPELTNVHSRMNEQYRETHAKVEITYTDPFLDNTIDITSSGAAYNTNEGQLADNVSLSAYKWFSLSNNTLDGNSRLIDSSQRLYSTGWWSKELSDENGNFEVPPVISVTFNPRSLTSLKVVGDDKLESYPVDFVINCYDSEMTLLYTHTITNNSDVYWRTDIPPVLNVAKLELIIYKINRPYDSAKITEFYTAVVETYYSDRIVDISLLEELDYSSGSITLGSISSNEVDIALDNSDGKFNFGNENSPLQGLMKRNRRVKVWLGTEIIPGEIEWYPLGTFWTIGWDMPDFSLEARITARDRLELLRYTDFTTSLLYENYSLYQLFEIVLNDAGLTTDDYIIDTSLQNIIIPYAWFDRMSHRNALERLAQCAYINVYCDREDRIRVEPIDTSQLVYFVLDDNVNIYSKSYPISQTEITNYVEVATNTITVKPLQEVLNIEEEMKIDPNSSLTLSLSFTTIPVKNVQQPIIVSDKEVEVEMQAYAWGVELTLTNPNDEPCTVTGITIQGQPLELSSKSFAIAKDDDLIRDNGKLKASISHDFIQRYSYAQELATTLLNVYKQSLYDVSIEARGNIGLYLGTKIQVNDSKMNTQYEYITRRQTIKWNGALSATIEGKKI